MNILEMLKWQINNLQQGDKTNMNFLLTCDKIFEMYLDYSLVKEANYKQMLTKDHIDIILNNESGRKKIINIEGNIISIVADKNIIGYTLTVN